MRHHIQSLWSNKKGCQLAANSLRHTPMTVPVFFVHCTWLATSQASIAKVIFFGTLCKELSKIFYL
jgi:hypothetical protein